MRPGAGDERAPGSYALYHFGTSGSAVAAATAATHPLDVIKVRLQMQHAGQRGNLVGMVLTAPIGFLFVACSDVNSILSYICIMHYVREQYLHNWSLGKGLGHSTWDLHQH